MKLFKYLSIFAVSAVALTSCSTDDTVDVVINTAPGVGVSMQTSEMIVNEMKGLFKVPLVVTGEPNGFVTVTVKITGTDDPNQDQAIADNNFYVTSTTVNIPADSKTAGVEIRTQYLESRDPDLYFRVTIESAEGATIEPLNSTTIAIQDRKSSPIYSLAGPWEISFTDYFGMTVVTPSATLDVINEETGECQFLAWYPALYKALVLPIVLRPDEATGIYNVCVPLGSVAAPSVNFNGIGESEVLITDTSGSTSGEYKAQWNADHTVAELSETLQLSVFNEGTFHGPWDRMSGMKFRPLITD